MVNIFEGPVLIKSVTPTGAADEGHFGFGFTAGGVGSTNARIVYVEASPNAVVTAPEGSLALRGDAGNGGLWLNTDSATAWTEFANP